MIRVSQYLEPRRRALFTFHHVTAERHERTRGARVEVLIEQDDPGMA
jgi:hypothetical protein